MHAHINRQTLPLMLPGNERWERKTAVFFKGVIESSRNACQIRAFQVMSNDLLQVQNSLLAGYKPFE